MTTHWVRAVGSICTTYALDATVRSQSGLTGASGTDAVSLTFDDRAAEMVDPSLAASTLARATPPALAPIREAAAAGAAPVERQASQQLTGF
jgi:hypothetical protein